jgi:hypothetical protein
VESRGLERVTWNHPGLINGDVLAELQKLRQRPGPNLQTWGNWQMGT